MKPVNHLLFFFLMMLATASYAQKKPFHPESQPIRWCTLGKIIAEGKLPVSAVQIWDRRADTSKLGYLKGRRFNRLQTAMPFETTVTDAITEGCRKALSGDTAPKLLIVIKNFWLDADAAEGSRDVNCMAVLEVYLYETTTFLPLFRVDTTFKMSTRVMETGDMVIAPFQLCLQKLQGLDLKIAGGRLRARTYEELVAHYQKNRQARSNDSLRKKGVYLTYNDFLQNKISFPDFKVVQKDLADLIYVRTNGQETLLDQLWGYCDGEKNFIRLKFNFFELHRQNGTYDLEGPAFMNHVTLHRGNGSSGASPFVQMAQGASIPAGRDQYVLKPMQLNMETGKPYGF